MPAWNRRVQRLSTKTTRLPLLIAPSARRVGVIYRIRFHLLVARDLDAIAHWIIDYVGPEAATRKLAEIETASATLKATPHKGRLRDEIARGIRAIPAARKTVVAFVVDDDAREILIYAVTYGGADWIKRTGALSR